MARIIVGHLMAEIIVGPYLMARIIVGHLMAGIIVGHSSF